MPMPVCGADILIFKQTKQALYIQTIKKQKTNSILLEWEDLRAGRLSGALVPVCFACAGGGDVENSTCPVTSASGKGWEVSMRRSASQCA